MAYPASAYPSHPYPMFLAFTELRRSMDTP